MQKPDAYLFANARRELKSIENFQLEIFDFKFSLLPGSAIAAVFRNQALINAAQEGTRSWLTRPRKFP
jgi:hypothetical protein